MHKPAPRPRASLALMLCILLSLNVTAFADGGDVPYAEENGFEFTTETEFDIPGFFYLKRDDKYLPNTDECKIEAYDGAVYTIGDFSLSEPDEDGLVELTFTLEMQASAFSAGTTDNERLYIYYLLPDFFDYYSGYTVSREDKDNGAVYTASFSNGRQNISVNGERLSSFDWSYGLGSWNKYNQWEQEHIISLSIKYDLKFPADYDGLCIYLSKLGLSEYDEEWETDTPVNESELFLDGLDDGRTANDYYMLRVSDLLAQAA